MHSHTAHAHLNREQWIQSQATERAFVAYIGRYICCHTPVHAHSDE